MVATDSVIGPVSPLPGSMDEGRPLTLLVVDDDHGVRQSLNVIFRGQFQVLLAEGGVRALELAAEHSIDAVVLDIRMADLTGIEVLDRLKNLQPEVEVVMLTGHESVETAKQALRLGACDYLTKPFELRTIRTAVARAMERRLLAEEMRTAGQRLVEVRTELQSARLKEELARARGEIYASIVHDINGPLTIISSFVDSINQRVGQAESVEGEGLEVIRDRLAKINRQVGNCIDLSRRYLGYVRDHNTGQPMAQVSQVLQDVSELLHAHPSMGQNRLEIELLAQDGLVALSGTELMQILLNLGVNAMQSTDQQHRVTIRCERVADATNSLRKVEGAIERALHFDSVRPGPYWRIEVSDDGPGIPPEILDRLFDAYFSTKVPGRGTGLGLAIVQRLVRRARGAIHLQTKLGAGSIFAVYLPAE